MKAKVAKYFQHDGPRSPYQLAVYWTHDSDLYPHDWDMILTPQEWRKVKCRTPKKNETIEVDIEITEKKV
jgi:hypothetical protein